MSDVLPSEQLSSKAPMSQKPKPSTDKIWAAFVKNANRSPAKREEFIAHTHAILAEVAPGVNVLELHDLQKGSRQARLPSGTLLESVEFHRLVRARLIDGHLEQNVPFSKRDRIPEVFGALTHKDYLGPVSLIEAQLTNLGQRVLNHLNETYGKPKMLSSTMMNVVMTRPTMRGTSPNDTPAP